MLTGLSAVIAVLRSSRHRQKFQYANTDSAHVVESEKRESMTIAQKLEALKKRCVQIMDCNECEAYDSNIGCCLRENTLMTIDKVNSLYGIMFPNGEEKEAVNHPDHYQLGGIEVIDIVENMSFNRGNAIKYLCRAGKKDKDKEIEDLKKAAWYIDREIQRMGKQDA